MAGSPTAQVSLQPHHADLCQNVGIRCEQHVSHAAINRGIERIGTPQDFDYFQRLVTGPAHAHLFVNDFACERSQLIESSQLLLCCDVVLVEA